MTRPGDIQNGPYAQRAKEYIWSKLSDVFPRGITPTDIDGMVEVGGCFFLFEGKTEGAEISTGQRLCFQRLLKSLPQGRAVLVIAEHVNLERIDVADGIRRLRLAWLRPDGDVKQSRWLEGPFGLGPVARQFTRDAETVGRLDPGCWFDRIAAEEVPFTEGDAA